jgi:hypothetical protein
MNEGNEEEFIQFIFVVLLTFCSLLPD